MTAVTTSLQQRQDELTARIAAAAFHKPELSHGYLFENDIRDNFYYASYLFAAAVNPAIAFDVDRKEAKEKAERVLIRVIALQDQQPASSTYSHWPLNLRPTPQEASKNTLPVELMGSLMVYFTDRYAQQMSGELKDTMEQALFHVYRGHFYRKPMDHYNHHEAKYTAAKLIFGQRYQDSALFEDGLQSLRATYRHVTTEGMPEYGALPWFWHWVQAYTCAWTLMQDQAVRKELGHLLDWLWQYRATYYLGGAWVGPHSRIWPHDMPQDTNVLHDYVQFGDFTLPEAMPRTEYAGFLVYEANAATRQLALERQEALEIRRLVPKGHDSRHLPGDHLHSYVYRTEHAAVGGIYERIREFDNEQHRWDVALPLDSVQGVNHAYFFHPDQEAPGDYRHQSEYSEVCFHRGTVMASYDIPADKPAYIKGCLPLGEWTERESAIFGRCGNVYLAVFLMQPYTCEVLADRRALRSEGSRNAVVVEVIDAGAASALGTDSVEALAAYLQDRQPQFSLTAEDQLNIVYTDTSGDTIVFESGPSSAPQRSINGIAVSFEAYTVA